MSNESADIPRIAPDMLRGLTMPRFSRRQALQLGGLGAAGLSLAACGIKPAGGSNFGGRQAVLDFWAKQTLHKQVRFGNWPLYIDVAANNDQDHPSLDLFMKQTGIKVTYTEPVQDNDTFFGKIAPQLAAKQDIGYDIIVMTNGLKLNKMLSLDYLMPLDQNRMNTFYANASPTVVNPTYDRGNTYTMAWQSGMTGIGFNPKFTGRDIVSWEDMQDPAFKGKIGMFGNNEDLPAAAMLALGIDPAASTPDQWQQAADWLRKQRPLVRKYYTQDYVDPLTKGDIWVSMAWSGDIFIANSSGANLKFVVPKEGALLWTDNMCIPAYAKNPLDAMTLMDWVYNPEPAAMIAEYVNYFTPVPKARDVMLKDAAAATNPEDKATLTDLANSPLIFPSEADMAKLHRYRLLTDEEEKNWNAIFEPIYQS